MPHPQLTTFPKLSKFQLGQGTSSESRHVVVDDLSAVERDILILAWASVLRAYTEDEDPSFLFDNSAVCVRAPEWRIDQCDWMGEQGCSRNAYTGICTTEKPPQTLALCLKKKSRPNTWVLESFDHVPDNHLPQIKRHLNLAIEWFSTNRNDALPRQILSSLPLSILNQRAPLLQGQKLLHQLCLQNTVENNCAIHFLNEWGNETEYTYETFRLMGNEVSQRLTRALSGLAPSKQPVISIFLPQCPELYISQLGVLLAGCAFCNIALDSPKDRLNFIFNDLASPLVITTSELEGKLPIDHTRSVLNIDNILRTANPAMSPASCFPVQEQNIAYIMYTSGSSGTPKGVPVSHLAVTQSLLAHKDHIPRFSRFLQFAAPTFDVSIFEIFFTFLMGATLVACDRTQLLRDLPSIIRRLAVDAAELTPTVAATLIRKRTEVPCLKLLLTIGEMLTPPVIEEFGGDGDSESMLWAMYGPTECAIHCTVQGAFDSRFKPGTIGSPLSTVSAFVIATGIPMRASDIEILPMGHIGELAIGGLQLAYCYLNRPEQTSAAFIDTKLWGQIYRTGDKARMLPDGSIECLGRISAGQVKLRGQRIELGEIEATVLKLENCNGAVAAVIDAVLVLFCTGGSLSEIQVMDTCQRWLPKIMVPGDVVIHPDFPKLASGKIDRKSLVTEYQMAREAAALGEQDLDERTKQTHGILESVLGQKFPISTTLTSAGLDSLSAIRAASELRSSRMLISPVDLLNCKTLLEALEYIQDARDEETTALSQLDDTMNQKLIVALESSPAFASIHRKIGMVSRCTTVQIAMLSETMKNPEVYCNWVLLECEQSVNTAMLISWLQELIEKNSMLRTGFGIFEDVSEHFLQVTWKTPAQDQISVVDTFDPDFTLSDEGLLAHTVRFKVIQISTRHQVLIQLHHAVYDGWSMDLILQDLNALASGNRIVFRPTFQSVVDYLLSARKQESLEYWTEHMSNFVPTAFPRLVADNTQEFLTCSKSRKLALPMDPFRSLAKEYGVSVHAIFQAALVYLLKEYCGTTDVSFAVVTSGRTIPVESIEHIIGPCLSTLPLRINTANCRSIEDLIQRVHGLNRRMLQYPNVSLRDIKMECGLSVECPLCDVLFVWQESLVSQNPGKQVIKVVESQDKLEFKLLIEMEPTNEGLQIKATYNQAWISGDQVNTLMHQIEDIGVAFIKEPKSTLLEASGFIRKASLSILNPNPTPSSIELGLAQFVEFRAKADPSQPAVAFLENLGDSPKIQMMSYEELDKEANRFSNHLSGYLRAEDSLVCVCLEKSFDLYVSILAVLKTGRGYLPITPQTPMQRIEVILRESGVKVCICNSNVLKCLDLHETYSVINLSSIDLSQSPDTFTSAGFEEYRPAYAMFTSGSTGAPKGVLVSQRNLISNLMALSKIYPYGTRILQACSQAFDVSAFEIFFAWYTGMCLCFATNDVLFQDIEACIRVLDVTHISLTPTVAALINPENVPKVQFLVTSGEAVAEKVKRLWAGRGLFQGYGPAETTNICTAKANVSALDLIHNIGEPFKNTSAFVFHPESENLILKGGIGELCFGGDQVFLGYLNRPDLTGHRTINHKSYGRLYRSGDLGRILPSDCIEFVARADDQIKIRGQRVELDEINRCILGVSEVIDCFTILVRVEMPKSEKLVSFFRAAEVDATEFLTTTLNPAIIELSAAIYHNLQEQLPLYMIPSNLIPVTTIPRTPQGKIDKRRLAATYDALDLEYLSQVGRQDETDAGETWTAEETAVRGLVSKVCKLDEQIISRNTSLLGLGIDSVSAIVLSRLLREAGFPNTTLSTVLRNPTVSKLAKALSGTSIIERRLTSPDIFSNETVKELRSDFSSEWKIGRILPCTPLQEAMLSATHGKNPESYCNFVMFKVIGDFERLINSVREVMSRHEIFRTVFLTSNDPAFPFAQLILDEFKPAVEEIVVSTYDDLTSRERIKAASKISSHVANRQPPYFLRLANCENQQFLLFACHHAMYDGAAIQILLSEIESHFHGITLDPAETSSIYLSEMVQMRSAEAVEYWAATLKGFAPCLVQSQTSTSFGSFQRHISTGLDRIDLAGRGLGFTRLHLVQAALLKTISAGLGCSDICFGNIVSGRSLPIHGIDKLVFPTFNTIPIRVDLNRHRSNQELLVELKKLSLAAEKFQLTPLRLIQSKVRFAQSGLFSTLLLLQKGAYQLNSKIWSLEEDVGLMNLPLVLELIPDHASNRLTATLHYEKSSFTQSVVEGFVNLFDASLQECVRYPESASNTSALRFNEAFSSLRENLYYPVKDVIPVHQDFTFMDAEHAAHLRRILVDFCDVPAEQITPSTTIYQLGLDSISAIQLAKRLRNLTGKDILAPDILEKPLVSDLLELLQKDSVTSRRTNKLDFSHFENTTKSEIAARFKFDIDCIESIRPCTPLQAGLLSTFIRTRTAYINHFSFKPNRVSNAAKLFDAWQETTKKHIMLRTGFVDIKAEQRFAMISHAPGSFQLPVSVHKSSLSREELKKWRNDTVGRIAKHLQLPPWRALISSGHDEIVCHVSMFHGLYDAQSLRILLDDLVLSYSGQCGTQTPSIDRILSCILASSSPELVGEKESESADKMFWLQELKNATIRGFPDLNPLRVSENKAVVVQKTCSTTFSALKAACSHAGSTIQATGAAVWAKILSAYLGDADVIFGVVLSGRDLVPNADRVAFPCITTIPVSVNNGGSNAELVNSITSFLSRARRYQFTPLTKIQRVVGRPKDTLFDTIFAYQVFEGDQNHEWTIYNEEASDEYAVSMELEPSTDDRLIVRITSREDIMPVQHAGIILDQFDNLLSNILCGEGNAMTSATEKGMLSRVYSVLPARIPSLQSSVTLVHQFVEHQAKKFPNAIALEFVDRITPKLCRRTWTYAELDGKGELIASCLLKRRVIPGELVGICFDKCPEASFAILGILKAGCAFVALDPRSPIARKRFILQDSGAKLLLTADASCGPLAPSSTNGTKNVDLDVELIFVDEIKIDEEDSQKVDRNEVDVDSQSICYCLYTSGTTGLPKGCEITHENVVQAMRAFSQQFDNHWNSSSKWLQFASFHFDVSILEQYWSWSEGISVVAAPRDIVLEDLSAAIRSLEITHIDLTPSLAVLLNPEDVPSLCKGIFITGGEALKQEILDIWGPKHVIYNGYGPTEATIGVTMFPRVPPNGRPLNIGRQFDNVGTYVLLPDTEEPVLRGGVGELCVSGKLVGRGYLNKADLTARKFPYLETFGDRVYRTGDLVRVLHDGSFLFIGRYDEQVKLRGQRLEIGEINNVIKSHSSIRDVVTFVLKHPQQVREQLVSFLLLEQKNKKPKGLEIQTPSPAIKSTTLKVLDTCRGRLPPYMVPTYLIPMTYLPLSANNKIDGTRIKEFYMSLSQSDLQNISAGTNIRPLLNREEARITDALVKAFQIDIDNVRPSSNIFELGLDSISVIGFSRILREGGFAHARPSTILQCTSIESLAEKLKYPGEHETNVGQTLVAQQRVNASYQKFRGLASQILSEDVGNIEAIAPCTPLQEGMVYESLAHTQSEYFVQFIFDLNLTLDIDRLKQAWNTLSEGLQILRTKFVRTNDGFIQVVCRNWKPVSQHHTLTNGQTFEALSGQLKEDWMRQNREHIQSPFQLHFVVLAQQSKLVLQIFHALYDGISLRLVFQKLLEIYKGVDGVQFGPAFQSTLAAGPLCTKSGAKEFWRGHLTSESGLGKCHSSANSSSVASARLEMSVAGFEKARRNLNATHQALVQACWVSALQSLRSISTIGMVVSGRSIGDENVTDVIGPLFNTIPCRIAVSPGESWDMVVQKCHEFNVNSAPFHHTPLKDVIKWCRPSGDHKALFDNIFVFHLSKISEVDPMNNEFWKLKDDEPTSVHYPLAFEAEMDQNENLKVLIVSQDDSFNKPHLDTLMSSFDSAVRSLLKNPDGNVGLTFPTLQLFTDELQVSPPETRNSTETVNQDEFLWTDDALIIRQEIAKLAEIDDQGIRRITTVFEVGLDSIDCIKLVSRLSKLGIIISVSTMMRNPSVQGMVQSCTRSESSQKTQADSLEDQERRLRESFADKCIRTIDCERILPPTPLQEAMVTEMQDSGFTRYFNHDILKVAAGVDMNRLKKAWSSVYAKNPIFRIRFIPITDPLLDCSYAQIQERDKQLTWKHKSLASLEEVHEYLTSISAEVAAAGDEQRLFRITEVETPQALMLILSISHALYDGWSIRLLHNDVHSEYRNKSFFRQPFDPILQEMLNGAGPKAAEFWKGYISGALPCRLTRHRREKTGSWKSIRREKESLTTLADAKAFCKSQGVSLQALGQTCWSLVLAHRTQSLDVIFGVILSGRDSEMAQSIQFPTMNTVAIRSIIHGSASDMLKYTQYDLSQIRQFQFFPLRKIQRYAQTPGVELLDTLFIFQIQPQSEHPGSLYESVGGSSKVELPLCVEIEGLGDRLIWRIACDGSLFEEQEVESLVEHLDQILTRTVCYPEVMCLAIEEEGVRIMQLPPVSLVSTPESDEKLPNQGSEQALNRYRDLEKESIIRSALSAISGVSEDEISTNTTIFHLGMDSISAIKLSAFLKDNGINLTVGKIMANPTVAQMSLVPAQGEDKGPQFPKSRYDETELRETLFTMGLLENDMTPSDLLEDVLDATPGQIHTISGWLNSGGELFYHCHNLTVKQAPGINCTRDIVQAWSIMMEKHPILRTIFVALKSCEWPMLQLVLKPRAIEMARHNTLDDNCKQPWHRIEFDEEGGVPGEWSVKLHMHHALYDANSLSALFGEFEAELYRLPTTSEIHSSRLMSLTDPESMNHSRKYWSSYLRIFQGARTVYRSDDTWTNISTKQRMEHIEAILSHSQMKLFEENCRVAGVTFETSFLGIFAELFCKLNHEELSSSKSPSGCRLLSFGLWHHNDAVRRDYHHCYSTDPIFNIVPLIVSRDSENESSLNATRQGEPPNVSELNTKYSARNIWKNRALLSRIQQHLNALSEPKNSSFPFWATRDLGYELTMDVVFNFLVGAESRGSKRLGIRSLEKKPLVIGKGQRRSKCFHQPLELTACKFGEIYKPSIEIEIAKSSDGLVVGFFAPQKLIKGLGGMSLLTQGLVEAMVAACEMR